MKLKISEYADTQLSQITDYGLKEWGRTRSSEYLTGLFGTFDTLCEFTEIGTVFSSNWPFMHGKEIRFFPYKRHQIFYWFDADTVTIIAVGSHWQLPENVLP